MMRNAQGEFIWYELLTSDVQGAAGFYGAVLGWRARSAGEDMGGYQLLSAGGVDVAGLMKLPDEAAGNGMRPGWLGYIGVNDVDAMASDVAASGGRQYMPPTDIPGVGRFAMLADPQGIAFYVMRGAMDERSVSFSPDRVGHCHWNELSTPDPAAALSFYGSRFGWTLGDAMPMGELGDYQFIHHQGQMIGAVMRNPKEGPPPMWNFYFGVDDIDTAARAVSAGGGNISYGPAEVPGGSHIIVGTDPQGAVFGLVGPRKQPA
ncbi:MAG: VOC family protein [Burkholderiaceae bacterium]